ncbi:MAG TPA: hydantoinase/oxoprolinase family protein [Gaiellaceae bacterium]|nr:hydantoinase/oxoprolinase family protein [Gaiellaceae bacterium]
MTYRVAMDIGGTFTDLVVVEDEQRTYPGKVLSTPGNPADGVIHGLESFVPDLTAIDFIVHGTTVGLNAFLERKGTRVLLLMTEGLRDAYSIARHDRKELYTLRYRKPQRLVPRRDVLEVRERLRWDGSVEIPLDESSLDPVIQRIQAEGIAAVAVCLVHSYVNPEHELRVRDALVRACPDLSVTLSHEIAREWREYERSSSAVLNAYIAPPVERYLDALQKELDERDVSPTLYVMQSNGGVTTARTARDQPIQTLLSGPVGGTIGGAALARATGRPNLLCVDMGGTSFDLSLIVGGSPSVSTEAELEGLPVLLSLVDIHTIGAGGGSLAWLEAGGLRVGPQSAGADPGPACYGRGGTEPTVTDANLFLGRLDPHHFLGGRMSLDTDASARALRSVGAQLGLDDTSFAEGILQIVNAKMADAMRTITVRQGIDPREYSLVAFGGAGPMHAVWLAEELDIAEVVVPWSPGTFSAWGMLQTDMRHDVVRSFFSPLAATTADAVASVYGELEEEAARLLAAEGVEEAARYAVRSADMRYVGQEYTVAVTVGGRVDLAEIEASFHEAHAVRYGHAAPGEQVELVNLRLAAMGRLGGRPAPFRSPDGSADLVLGRRPVVFGGEQHDTAVLARELLPAGWSHRGPIIVEELSATTVVPPGYAAKVDDHGNLLIGREVA